MGEIYSVSCTCKYSKKLYVGGGLSSCNLHVINNIFSKEKLKAFNDYYINNNVQSFYFENKPALCEKCKELTTVEVLKFQLSSGRQLTIINDCHTCKSKVTIIKELLCPKCGAKMNIEELGLWD